MRILIDGCDGTGKTSVCEKLANSLGYNITRLTHDGDRSFRTYMEIMIPDKMVHDRTFISEIIYPKYFNRNSRLNLKNICSLHDLIELYDTKVFILTASHKVICERIGVRGDEFITDYSIFEQINEEYRRYAMNNSFDIIDTSYKTIDAIVNDIIIKAGVKNEHCYKK